MKMSNDPAKNPPGCQRQSPLDPARCYAAHHVLKCWPEYFEAIGEGRKTFEVREDDRNFQVGDSLELREWNPKTQEYTCRWIFCKVKYVLRGGSFGVSPNHVVMAIQLPANHQWPIPAPHNGELCRAAKNQ